MAPPPLPSKKRKVLDGMNGKITRPKKKFKKQLEYHSSSDEEDAADKSDFAPVNLLDSDAEDENSTEAKKESKSASKNSVKKPSEQKQQEEEKGASGDSDTNASEDDSESDEDGDDDSSGDESGSDASSEDDSSDNESSLDGKTKNNNQRRVPKRNDPAAFSTSISKILATKLPTSARADPVLSRSKAAAQTTEELANEKLEKQARAKLRAEKKEELDRGRIRDVLGIERGVAGQTAEEEKRLRKIAQRGVVKLFNAVRAAQVRGEEAAREERRKGTIGVEERKKAVNEVSKQGFLELINGKKGKPLTIEEA
ncbi:hypothetical protein VTN77DRAFT_2698 [Rasamsonia byssochlamydoides]|uniref:uncharacterized protein n=1 Tax=Rasamsonia byssochlamydoides TaxID=89139 RepID=UPI0037442D8E